MDPYMLIDEVGMVISCMTLRLSMSKVRYVVHLQWDIMRKAPTAWESLYAMVTLGMGDTNVSRYIIKFMVTVCPTRWPWFGRFMRGSKFSMGVINRQ